MSAAIWMYCVSSIYILLIINLINQLIISTFVLSHIHKTLICPKHLPDSSQLHPFAKLNDHFAISVLWSFVVFRKYGRLLSSSHHGFRAQWSSLSAILEFLHDSTTLIDSAASVYVCVLWFHKSSSPPQCEYIRTTVNKYSMIINKSEQCSDVHNIKLVQVSTNDMSKFRNRVNASSMHWDKNCLFYHNFTKLKLIVSTEQGRLYDNVLKEAGHYVCIYTCTVLKKIHEY